MWDRARRLAGRGAVVLMAIVLLPLALAVSEAAAQTRELFQIQDVRVDETAESAEAARQKALATGERKAFEALLERITRPEDRATLQSLAQAEIGALVKDFWISDEKASTVRYVAVLNFNFREARVRDFLRRRAVAFTTQPSKPLLVIPLYQTETGPLLWEGENLWRAAWEGQQGTDLVPVRLPDAASDAPLLSTEQALAGDPVLLAGIAQRHGAGEALVVSAHAPPPASPDQPVELSITTSRLDRSGKPVATTQTFRAKPGEDLGALLKRGAKETVLNLDAAWKGQVRTQARPVAVNAVDVPIVGLRDWLALRRQLGGIDAITAVNVVLFARDRVRVNLVYASRPEDLVNALQAAGLNLTLADEVWTLRVAPPAPAQGT